jgi:LysR family transcriptional regulator, low CO2-responsive transcriptional regulator
MLLHRIELFVNVARHQNLGKTAREMHVSASSVCQRLKSLESEFGAKLYTKNKHGIELTGAGRTFLGTASEVLNQLETLKKTLHPESVTESGTLIVGGTYNPSARYLPGAIAAFQKMHPNIEVRFLTSDGPSVEKLVRDAEVDIALLHNPAKSSDFNMEHFASDHLTFFAHPAHPLAKKKKLEFEDLAHTSIIVRDGTDATDKMLREIKSRGLTVNVALRCASPDAVKAAVRRKMGIGILFYNLIDGEIRRKYLKILRFSGLPKLVGNCFIVYSKNRPLSCAGSEFLSLLRTMRTRFKSPVSISNAE